LRMPVFRFIRHGGKKKKVWKWNRKMPTCTFKKLIDRKKLPGKTLQKTWTREARGRLGAAKIKKVKSERARPKFSEGIRTMT